MDWTDLPIYEISTVIFSSRLTLSDRTLTRNFYLWFFHQATTASLILQPTALRIRIKFTQRYNCTHLKLISHSASTPKHGGFFGIAKRKDFTEWTPPMEKHCRNAHWCTVSLLLSQIPLTTVLLSARPHHRVQYIASLPGQCSIFCHCFMGAEKSAQNMHFYNAQLRIPLLGNWSVVECWDWPGTLTRIGPW
jgi:hypothetical protein